jgi:hypothetical protein
VVTLPAGGTSAGMVRSPSAGALPLRAPRVPTDGKAHNGSRRSRYAMLYVHQRGACLKARHEAWQRACRHRPVDDRYCGESQSQYDRNGAHASSPLNRFISP